jgi:hypothetical protein
MTNRNSTDARGPGRKDHLQDFIGLFVGQEAIAGLQQRDGSM